LPADYEYRPLPLVLTFHGTGADGAAAISDLLAAATTHSLIVVAPDSGRAPDGTATWQVGDGRGDRTPDFEHTLACLAEAERLPGVRVQRRLAMGYSGGASSAPYLATNDSRFDAFAALHGGAFVGGFGTNRVRGWFSTGQRDDWRPPTQVRGVAEQVRHLGHAVTWREFPGGHGLEPLEVEAVVEWWLSPQ
jgi:predicted esterase